MNKLRPRQLAAVAVTLALAACGQDESAPPPQGMTAGEARALDEAAELIEQRRLPPEALRASEPAPGTGDLDAPAAP